MKSIKGKENTRPGEAFFESERIKKSMSNPEFRKGVEEELFMLEIAESLSSLRHKAKLSQRALATKAKIKQQEICDIEKGQRNITARTISKIAKSLGYQPEITYHKIHSAHV
jgi:DNA-binding XRE family transcriptional regulator